MIVRLWQDLHFPKRNSDSSPTNPSPSRARSVERRQFSLIVEPQLTNPKFNRLSQCIQQIITMHTTERGPPFLLLPTPPPMPDRFALLSNRLVSTLRNTLGMYSDIFVRVLQHARMLRMLPEQRGTSKLLLVQSWMSSSRPRTYHPSSMLSKSRTSTVVVSSLRSLLTLVRTRSETLLWMAPRAVDTGAPIRSLSERVLWAVLRVSAR